jgi:signal transduction histidine kinase
VRRRIASLPIRAQLTVVLVLLVITLAASLIFISDRAACRSLEEHTVASLEIVADTRARGLSATVDRLAERMSETTKSVELACDFGRLNLACAGDILRSFLREERARGAQLTYGHGKHAVFGSFSSVYPAATSPVTFHRDQNDDVEFRMEYTDAESGLILKVDFPSAVLTETAPAGPTHWPQFVTLVDGELRSLSAGQKIALPSAALQRCLQGGSAWALDSSNTGPVYRAYRSTSGVSACVITEMSQAMAMAPISRLTAKLGKMVLGFTIGSLVVVYFLGYFLTRPLEMLKKRIGQLKHGDFDSRVPIVGTGEIRDFSEALASTTEALRLSRRALLESERKLLLAYKAAKLWIWSFDIASGRVTWENPADPGSQPRTLSLSCALRSIHNADRRAVVNAIRAAKTSDVFEVEYRLKTKGPDETWISSWGEVVRDDTGRAAAIVAVSLNATSRKQAQRLVSEREKLLATADMAASLAHEINNPLTAVVGALQMLPASAVVTPEAQRYVDMARNNSDRIVRIARQMLALYRKPSNAEAINIGQLLEDVVAACRCQAAGKQHRFELDVRCKGNIFGFAEEIRQALMNLVTNALEHSPDGAAIRIRAYRTHAFRRSALAEQGVRIVVANRSNHELPDEAAAAFVSTKNQTGRGLGLWVTRSVILKHGGTLRLRSFGRNRTGVCCAIYLPMRFVTSHSASALSGVTGGLAKHDHLFSAVKAHSYASPVRQ